MSLLKSIFSPTPEPDFDFASKGYVQVAVMRRQGKDEAYLRALERGIGLEILKGGHSERRALSARWGGCLSIEDDLDLFDIAVRKGKEEATALGVLPAANNDLGLAIYRVIYERAGDFATRCAWEGDRRIYRRFLNFVHR